MSQPKLTVSIIVYWGARSRKRLAEYSFSP